MIQSLDPPSPSLVLTRKWWMRFQIPVLRLGDRFYCESQSQSVQFRHILDIWSWFYNGLNFISTFKWVVRSKNPRGYVRVDSLGEILLFIRSKSDKNWPRTGVSLTQKWFLSESRWLGKPTSLASDVREQSTNRIREKKRDDQSGHVVLHGEMWTSDAACQTATLLGSHVKHAWRCLAFLKKRRSFLHISPHFHVAFAICMFGTLVLGQFLPDFVRVKSNVSPRLSTSSTFQHIHGNFLTELPL